MSSDNVFRVGITPDLGEAETESIIGPALREIFDPIPNLTYEMMPVTESGVAEAEINDRYDAMVVFMYRFPTESLQGLKRLKCLARWGVGCDLIDLKTAAANGVPVAITPTNIRRTVSEGVLAMIFALAKQLRPLDMRVRDGRWRKDIRPDGICIKGRTLGSIGVGNIAGELFRMCGSLGFGRLLGYDPYCTPERARELGVELVDLDTLLRESDFVTINTPLTPETENLIDARALSLMKPTAYLINTSRGQVIDEEALLDALVNGRIAGAGLDVLRQEPPPRDHPFLKLDNAILAPHSVAWTIEGVTGNSLELCTNVRAIYEGKTPPYISNPAATESEAFKQKMAEWAERAG